MTPEELLKLCDEIEAKLKGATPGPWVVTPGDVLHRWTNGVPHSLYTYAAQSPKDMEISCLLYNAAQLLIDAARESVRLRKELHKANSQAEHFEREWYLCGDELEKVREELKRIQAFPELEWADVTAAIMEVLAQAARAGFSVRESKVVDAIDKGKAYVSRLRAELDKMRKERDEAYERAAQVCESEAVDFVATGEESDEAYNQGISDAAMAIRALKDKPCT